ncbi:MAG: DUF268 domain-containing protein [Candidatus Pacebacteria bacterium]|nr:DUF268 domain-containing protein [Candidatus Paceibacterota bacterium]
MKKTVKKLIRIIQTPFILNDWMKYKRIVTRDSKEGKATRFTLKFRDTYPFIRDKTMMTGFDRHYVFHTSWAARKVKEINPIFHTDISSSLYFCGIVSAFVPVKFYDYRPAELNLTNLESSRGDLMNLPFDDNSIDSISCMHTIEHIGLGRYGDPLDTEADLKAIKELIRVTKPGGSILFVTPLGGVAKIEYNAHRIYTYDYILEYFKDLDLAEFSLIPEYAKDGGIITHATKAQADKENYGCGCFWFKKKSL